MKKYRIVERTYESGNIEYLIQKRESIFFWTIIGVNYPTVETAKQAIDCMIEVDKDNTIKATRVIE